jgi:hypothetical protein
VERREATIDFSAVDRNGPFDPERLVELGLEQLKKDVVAAKKQKDHAVTSAADALAEVFVASAVMNEAPRALDRNEMERWEQLKILLGDDLDEADEAKRRLDELSEQGDRIRGLVTDIGRHHLSQSARYLELGNHLKQFINILPNAERQVRLARVVSWFIRAGFFLAALVCAFILERFLGDRVEWVFEQLSHEHAKDAAIAFFYLAVLIFIDKPKERLLQNIHWKLFERIKGAREKDLKRIEEIETSLKRLAVPSA